MTLHAYLWSLRMSVAVTIISFIAVIYYINPLTRGAIAYVLFYTTLFLAVTSIGVSVFTRLWHWRAGEQMHGREIRIAVRQGALLGLFVCILALLQQTRLLVWWDVLLVMGGIILIEVHSALRTRA